RRLASLPSDCAKNLPHDKNCKQNGTACRRDSSRQKPKRPPLRPLLPRRNNHARGCKGRSKHSLDRFRKLRLPWLTSRASDASRSEEHTSELQSRENIVCRL